MSDSTSTHWADIAADRVVRERASLSEDRPRYTCASGITPSGTVHIGNFREIISVDLVVRALRDKGQPVRFIYSWDDYDVFRKVPRNVPDAAELQKYLRRPITSVPDPWGNEQSYARANEVALERELVRVGVEPEYIYQAARYRAASYAEGIKTALEKRDVIRAILDEFRTEPLPEEWWPISVFSGFTDRDTTEIVSWDGEYGVTYRCTETGNVETVDLRTTGLVKLPWRVDWPMRWEYERVDFEPAGKEHHSDGGSFDTARRVSSAVYGFDAPVTFKYDFISLKGAGGKMSSSTGDVVSLVDVLEVYQPEIVRYLFAGTRPNAEFAISFDLDVIKIYEDYDKCERIYFGLEDVGEKRRLKESRIYELSQVDATPSVAPTQVPFRHLCNLLQITNGDIPRALALFPGSETIDAESRRRAEQRAACGWNWIRTYAPEDFRFSLRPADDDPVEMTDEVRRAVHALRAEIRDNFPDHDERTLGDAIYRAAETGGTDPKELFSAMYRALIGKEKGPRLAGFIITIGREHVLSVLDRY